MNFLSKTFSSLTGTSIPYTFKEKEVDPRLGIFPDSASVWTIYKGLNPKNDNTPVTIFEFNLRDSANADLEPLARNCFRKSKLLKLPGVISVIDYIEDESYLYIITEPVVPLYRYLQVNDGKVSTDSKVCGIYEIGQTLLLINSKCNSLHGNLGLFSSVFVTPSGDWKLFGFELLTNLTSDPDQPIYRFLNIQQGFNCTLPEDGLDSVRQFPLKLDSFKFGSFIYSVFNIHHMKSLGVKVTQSELNSMVNIPRQLTVACKRLVGAKLGLRPTVEKFMLDTESYFERNKLIIFSHELNEIKFKSEVEKLEFFKTYLSNFISEEDVNSFPPGFLEHKVLSELLSQYENIQKQKVTISSTPEEVQSRQETTSVLLNYILKFGVAIQESNFTKLIKPIIFQAFTLPDRSIRLTLLNHLTQYAPMLTESDVQLNIFTPLLSGFQDTNFTIRETTLRSITTIIDKVSVKQVNQELLKVLAKSQMDPKPSIRTNTLVLIIKISSKIYNTSKNNVLITALSKSLRDTFTPCKMMALSGFESLIDEFSLNEICGKILGHIAISLMDPQSFKVRTEARRIFELYLKSVEEHASSLPKVEDDEEAEEKAFFAKFAPQQLEEEKSNPTESREWNLDFAFAKFGMSNSGKLNDEFNVSTPDLTRITTPTTERIPTVKVPKSAIAQNNWNDDFDVDDSWGGDDEVVEKVVARPKKASSMKLGSKKTIVKPAKTVGNALKLDLKVQEDEDENWDGDW